MSKVYVPLLVDINDDNDVILGVFTSERKAIECVINYLIDSEYLDYRLYKKGPEIKSDINDFRRMLLECRHNIVDLIYQYGDGMYTKYWMYKIHEDYINNDNDAIGLIDNLVDLGYLKYEFKIEATTNSFHNMLL